MIPSLSRADLHRIITAAVIEAVERGRLTNAMPRTGGSPPLKLGSGTPCRGVNALHLRAVANLRGYRPTTWDRFPAWRARGGHVRRGERGTLVACALTTDAPSTPTDGPGTRRVIRTFTVFNRDQVDGLPGELAPCASAGTPPGLIGPSSRALMRSWKGSMPGYVEAARGRSTTAARTARDRVADRAVHGHTGRYARHRLRLDARTRELVH